MSNHPNMSYCAVRNTNLALGQILNMIDDYDDMDQWFESLSIEEQQAWRSLADKIETIYLNSNDEEDI